MKLIILICAITVLTGCAVSAFKDGASQADFSNDALECKAVGMRLGDRNGGLTPIVNGIALDGNARVCMQGKGWDIER